MTMTPAFRLKLMFEWGGGSLWVDNNHTRERFGVGPIEHKLPLSDIVLKTLEDMQVWHDSALNWDDPTGASPWTAEQFETFNRAVAVIKTKIEQELGPKFEVIYQQLGKASNSSA